MDKAPYAASKELTSKLSDGVRIHFHQRSWKGYMMDLSIAAIPLVIGIFAYRKMLKQYMGSSEKDDAARRALQERLARSGRPIDLPPTDKYENKLMADLLFSGQISVGFDDVGGLAHVKEAIYETVILPLQNPGLFAPSEAGAPGAGSGGQPLLSPPRGVLFYGPPGTGKTMVAKAIAHDSKATFINVRMSTIQDKWFGESQKLVRAIFSLAHKFQPSIIFIDEIDLFLKQRGGSSDHEASGHIKGEFMMLWDGLTTDSSAQVCVLGATNRPYDVDPAILRRMPRTFCFSLPDEKERRLILDVLLKGQAVAEGLDVQAVARRTEGYSGSDLMELCRYAAMLPTREVIRRHRERKENLESTQITERPRPVTMEDFEEGMLNVRPTGRVAVEYLKNFDSKSGRQRPGSGSSS